MIGPDSERVRHWEARWSDPNLFRGLRKSASDPRGANWRQTQDVLFSCFIYVVLLGPTDEMDQGYGDVFGSAVGVE